MVPILDFLKSKETSLLFIYSFIFHLVRYLLSSYYMSGVVCGDTDVDKMHRIPLLVEFMF